MAVERKYAILIGITVFLSTIFMFRINRKNNSYEGIIFPMAFSKGELQQMRVGGMPRTDARAGLPICLPPPRPS